MERDTGKKGRSHKKEDYRVRTHLIHGNCESNRWDHDPMSFYG